MFNKYLVMITLLVISGCNSDDSDFESEIMEEAPPVSEGNPTSESEEILTSPSKPDDSVIPASKPDGSVIPASKPDDSVIPASKPDGSVVPASKPDEDLIPSETVAVSSKIERLYLDNSFYSVVQNQTLKIKAFAVYSMQTKKDVTSEVKWFSSEVKDVTSEVNWFSSDQKIATINAHGELLGLVPGTVDITAEKEGLVTKQFSVTVKTHLMSCGAINDSNRSNASEGCLKVVQGKAGEAEHKLFTSPPSVNVMALLGYEINDTVNNRGKTYASTTIPETRCTNAKQETKRCAPDGIFARFRQDGKGWDDNPLSPDFGKNGQYDRFCSELSSIGFFDKDDWRRVREEEIDNLVKYNGNLFERYGWPAKYFYWSSTSKGNRFVGIGGLLAIVHSPNIASQSLHTSCVSETL